MLHLIVTQSQIVLCLARIFNNFLAKELINQSSRAQLGLWLPDAIVFIHFCLSILIELLNLNPPSLVLLGIPVVLKGLLVMIEPVFGWIKDSTHIALQVKLVKNLLVSRSDNDTPFELAGSQQQTCRHYLIAVEAVRMRANQLEVFSEGVIEELLPKFVFVLSANNHKVLSDARGVVQQVKELGWFSLGFHKLRLNYLLKII